MGMKFRKYGILETEICIILDVLFLRSYLETLLNILKYYLICT